MLAIFSSTFPSQAAFGMAGGIAVIAIFLGLWQWYDKRAREPDLDGLDRDFYERQDRRRWVGIGLMALLGSAILLDPCAGPRIHDRFKALWLFAIVLVLVGLILALLALAMSDWTATRRYAHLHRRALAKENSKFMLEVLRRAGSADSSPSNADSSPSNADSKSEAREI